MRLRFGNLLVLSLALTLSIPILSLFLSWLPFAELKSSYLTDSNLIYEYVSNSIYIALLTSLFSTLIGVLAAWTTTMCQFPFRKTFSWLLVAPFAVPSYVAAIIYGYMLEGAGPIQDFIRQQANLNFGEYWFPQIRSIHGAIFILTITLYPYIYIVARSAFLVQSNQMLETAKSLGSNNYEIFYKVALPLSRPAIITGISLVMMESLSDFGVVSLFGIPSFTTGIYRIWQGFYDPISAARLASLLLIFVLFLLWLEKKSRKKARFENITGLYHPLELIKLSKLKSILVCCFLLLPVILGFFIPLFIIIIFSLENFEIFAREDIWQASFNSVRISLIVATFACIIGLIFAYSLRQKQSFLFQKVIKFATFGYAIPGSVIAIGTLLFLTTLQNDILSGKIFLTGSIFGIIWGCTIRFLTISFNNSEAGLVKIPYVMDSVSKSLGFNRFEILKLIHIPILKASLFSGFILVFIDTIKELPATLLLRPFNFNSLAIKTYELAKDDLIQHAAPPAFILIVISLIPVWLLSKKLSNSRPGVS